MLFCAATSLPFLSPFSWHESSILKDMTWWYWISQKILDFVYGEVLCLSVHFSAKGNSLFTLFTNCSNMNNKAKVPNKHSNYSIMNDVSSKKSEIQVTSQQENRKLLEKIEWFSTKHHLPMFCSCWFCSALSVMVLKASLEGCKCCSFSLAKKVHSWLLQHLIMHLSWYL